MGLTKDDCVLNQIGTGWWGGGEDLRKSCEPDKILSLFPELQHFPPTGGSRVLTEK